MEMKLYSLFKECRTISTDSRNCPSGSLFFALKGGNFNANAFALGALEKGCAYAVVDEAEYAIDERFILVDDVLKTLQELARYHRKQLGLPIIGITGTNGKTTTKELIASVLKQKYNIHYTQGNLNNHIGVPLTLLQLTEAHEMAVVEMGANHLGEIKELAEIACPDYGIITNVGMAHLEGFGSFEGVKATKSELYEYVNHQGKTIFLNEDNSHLIEMALSKGFVVGSVRVETFSLSNGGNSQVLAEVISNSPFLSLRCKVGDAQFDVATQLIGAYNAENVLAAIAIGNYLGVKIESIKAGLENYSPSNNRSQLTVTDSNKLIVDAYNANPTSMRAAIKNFGSMEVEHKVVILGDMLELGEQTHDEHRDVVTLVNEQDFDKAIFVGKYFYQIATGFACFEQVDDLVNYLHANPVRGAYVLIKGSRGIKLEKVIESL